MTYQPHALLRFGGSWFGAEQWSCGVRIATDDFGNTVQNWIDALEPNEPGGVPTLLTDAREHVEAWFLRPQSYISENATLEYVSLNAIQPDGDYADPGDPHNDVFEPQDVLTGTSVIQTWPQLTTCISLRTAVTRGLATRGRMYAPSAPNAVGSGRIAATTTQDMAGSFATFVEDIATLESIALAGQPRVVVVSGVGAPGPMRIVTKILVGDVQDTQRRRRNELDEVYAEADAVTA